MPPCTVPVPFVISRRYGSLRTHQSGPSSSRLGDNHPSAGESARRFLRRARRSGASPVRSCAAVCRLTKALFYAIFCPNRGASVRGLPFPFPGVIRELLRPPSGVVEVFGHLDDRAGDVGIADLVLAL